MKKILFAFFFLLFATQIVAQVEIPKLKSSDLEFLMSMNLLGKEDYLSFLKFVGISE